MSGWQGKHGVFLIAEIGGNHEGDFDYAQKLTQLACESGVDAVKFQIYTGDTLVSSIEDSVRNKHFKKFELTPEQYLDLAIICRANGVAFSASVWDLNAMRWIDRYISFYKIGSGDLTAYPLLKGIAETGKPIVLSTGLSTLKEVGESIGFIQKQNSIYTDKENLAVLQCTSMYPISDDEVNLNVMHQYKELFELTVGYSDHTIGNTAVEQAITMGAEVIEMHFTDDREGKTFRDHQISFTKKEIKNLVDRIEKIKIFQGSGEKHIQKSEVDSGHINSFRRAVYPTRDIDAGEMLTESNLTVLRPNKGIDARCFYEILGRRLIKKVKKHEKLAWDYIDKNQGDLDDRSVE